MQTSNAGALVTPQELRRALDLSTAVATDEHLAATCQAANETLGAYLTPDTDHGQHEACRKAGLAVATQIWTADHSPGGRITGTDLGPMVTPHLLGPGLVSRVRGLVARCWNVRGMVG